MCDMVSNIIVGLLTGAASSYFVNIIWKNKLDKLEDKENEKQFKSDFFYDIQAKCKHLERIQLELSFEETEERNQRIQRLIEFGPGTKTFSSGMTQDGKDVLSEIHSVRESIKKDIKDKQLSAQKSRDYKEKLFGLEIKLLSHITSYRNSWEEYKKNNQK